MSSSKTTDVPGYRKRTGLTAPRVPMDKNGLQENYPQTVTPPGPPTRAEVETQLRATSESIASRLDALKSELGLAGDTVKAIASKPLVTAALAVGAGLLVGKLLGSSRRPDDEDSDALTELLAREVETALDGGEAIDEAIHRVLAATGAPKSSAGSDAGGLLRLVVGTAIRSALAQVVKAASNRFTGGGDEGDISPDG